MASTPKYKSVPVYWNSRDNTVLNPDAIAAYRNQKVTAIPRHIWKFDSQHEFKVYLQLVRMYGAKRIKRQYKLHVVKPGICYPNGKTWKADFIIKDLYHPNGIYRVVEAKGLFLPEFANTLVQLETNLPLLFKKTIIVFSQSIPLEKRVVKALWNSELCDNLITLPQLKKLEVLP